MKLSVTGRRITLSGPIRDRIARKLAPVERLLNDSVVSVQCILSEERGRTVCEITAHARGDHMLHAVGRGTEPLAAVAVAVPKLEQQARKLADRWKTRRRAGGTREAAPPAPAVAPAQPARPAPRVIRARPDDVKPMSVEDAVLSFEDGARTFLVFRQASSDRVAILYRRGDGHLGLIEPDA